MHVCTLACVHTLILNLLIHHQSLSITSALGRAQTSCTTPLPWVVGAKLGLKRAAGDVPDLSFPAKQVKVKFVSANCVPGVLSWG